MGVGSEENNRRGPQQAGEHTNQSHTVPQAPSPVRCRKLEPSLQEGTGTVGGSRGCPFPNNAMGLKSHADHGGRFKL